MVDVGPWSAPVPDFDRFCASERGGVVGLAYVLCGDWGAAEDLAQDAFFAAYRQWSRLSTYDHPGAWVRRVVANRAVSRRRRLTSEAKAVTRLAGRRRPTTDTAPIDDEVWAAVRRLPARQAQVFALTYVDDLSLEQVGAVLEISAWHRQDPSAASAGGPGRGARTPLIHHRRPRRPPVSEHESSPIVGRPAVGPPGAAGADRQRRGAPPGRPGRPGDRRLGRQPRPAPPDGTRSRGGADPGRRRPRGRLAGRGSPAVHRADGCAGHRLHHQHRRQPARPCRRLEVADGVVAGRPAAHRGGRSGLRATDRRRQDST